MTEAEVRRRLAAEFERHGWEYDLDTAQNIASAVISSGVVDPSDLAKRASTTFLAASRADRVVLAAAIADALSGYQPKAPQGSGSQPTRLSFIAAGPADEARLRLGAEHREIKLRLQSATSPLLIDEWLAARPTDLIDILNKAQPDILHLAGHGGTTGIALEDDTGSAADVSTDQLAELARLAGANLRLVVLNSCESASQAAPIANVVPAAIGMAKSIADEMAIAFSAQLYASLAEGVQLERAFAQAKLQVSLAGLPDSEAPQLFLRADVSASTIRF